MIERSGERTNLKPSERTRMYQLRTACLVVWPWLLVAVNAVGDDGRTPAPRLLDIPPANTMPQQMERTVPVAAYDPDHVVPAQFQRSERDQYSLNGARSASSAPPSAPFRSSIPPEEKADVAGVNNAMATAGPPQTAKAPLLLSHTEQPKPLLPADKSKAQASSSTPSSKGIDSLLTVLGSLGVVVGLFLATMWCFRRGMPKATRQLPAEVVEVLGRSPLSGRQQMHVIRFGNKLVLAAVSPNGVDSISEITDPLEVDRLAGHCQTTSSFSSTGAFRSLLDRLDDRGPLAANEEARRPSRGLSSLLARRGQREEDEHV